jgi:hypothetical protein
MNAMEITPRSLDCWRRPSSSIRCTAVDDEEDAICAAAAAWIDVALGLAFPA